MFENVVHSSIQVGNAKRYRLLISSFTCFVVALGFFAYYVADAMAAPILPTPRDFVLFKEAPIKVIPVPPPPAEKKRVAHTPDPVPGPPLKPPDGFKPEPPVNGPTTDTPEGPGEVSGGNDGPPVPERTPVPLPPPPPPPQKPERPERLGLRPPTKVVDLKPVYPAIAQSARVQGVVIIEATIGINGMVQEAKILRSIPLLDSAALDAVRQWRYTPTLLNGVPVAVIITVTLNFTLQ